MSERGKQKNTILQTNNNEGGCDFSQKQARMEMQKEDERKIVSRMMKKV